MQMRQQNFEKHLDQQLVGFQDVITKLANKLTKTVACKTK